jgi:excinuclease UvrABC nuclease subunit
VREHLIEEHHVRGGRAFGGALRVKLAKVDSVDRRMQNALVEHYGSVRALRAAHRSDIASVAGVSFDVAAAIQKGVA